MTPDLPAAAEPRTVRRCVCCAAEGRTTLHRNEIARIAGLDLGYAVRACTECGAVYADGLAPAADYANYYRHCSKYDTHASVADIAPVDRRRAAFGAAFVAQHVPAGRRVLDLGCGAGVLLAEFARGGWGEVHGLDPAANAAAAAERLHGLRGVRQGTVDTVAAHYALGDYDLLCLMAVLEHLADPLATLRMLAAGLRPGAHLLVEVPSLERFARAPLEPYGEFSIEHVNFYSHGSLVDSAARAGLRPVAAAFLELWPEATDSLYVLLTRGDAEPRGHDDRALMAAYLAASARALEPAVARAAAAIGAGSTVIWGAGSHTARLVPVLERLGLAADVRGIIDSNPNLQGRSFGRYTVLAPDSLAALPEATVIISSFRSGAGIAASLAQHFPNAVCELYPSPPAGIQAMARRGPRDPS